MFYDKYLLLCNQAEKTPSGAALEMGFSKPTVNRWKKGGGITDLNAQKVADFFNVSVEWLRGETDDPTPLPPESIKKEPGPKTGDERSKLRVEAEELLNKMTDDQLRQFIRVAKAIMGE